MQTYFYKWFLLRGIAGVRKQVSKYYNTPVITPGIYNFARVLVELIKWVRKGRGGGWGRGEGLILCEAFLAKNDF